LASDSASRNGSDPRSTRVTIERVVVLGYILAVAVPPVGCVLGIGLGIWARSKHSPWIVLLSIVGALIWALIIGAGGLSSTNQGY
jgi:hypothetical protein